MKRTRHQLAILLGLLCLLLLPQASFAAPAAGLEFKLAYTDGRYVVSMRPNATPQSLNITLASQVTIKVPHGVDADKFAVDGTEWTLT